VTSPPLPRSTPAAEGVSSVGVTAFLDAAEADPGIALHSLMILRHGQVIAEGWWAPHRPTDARQLYSVSKSFTATALGLAVAEGRLALADKVVDHFPESASAAGPLVRTMTVEHLARMATGHHADTLPAMTHGGDRTDPVHAFLGLEPESPPGSVFAYNNGATYTLGAILQARTGQSLTDYLQPRLFDPLGIAPPFWDTMGGPRQIGFAGLHLTTEDVAGFGLLWAQGGRWQGQPLLAPDFVAAATRALTPNPGEPVPDWQQGYGYQFWRSRHGYRADGAFGQFCLVLPEQDAVVVITSETEVMQPLLDLVWQHLLPAFAGPGGDDDELAERLGRLTLRVEGQGAYPADDWMTARAVVPAADGDGWSLTLEDADRSLAIECGDGRWRRTSAPAGGDRVLVVEAQGRWPDPDTFVAELVLVQSAHRFTVTLHPGTGESVIRWRTVPLRAPSLVGLAAPPRDPLR
jgi:CubicO group peptidase (beta-lactamase class C family)